MTSHASFDTVKSEKRFCGVCRAKEGQSAC